MLSQQMFYKLQFRQACTWNLFLNCLDSKIWRLASIQCLKVKSVCQLNGTNLFSPQVRKSCQNRSKWTFVNRSQIYQLVLTLLRTGKSILPDLDKFPDSSFPCEYPKAIFKSLVGLGKNSCIQPTYLVTRTSIWSDEQQEGLLVER